MPKEKTKKIRDLPKTLHIFCEGEKTEPRYIESYISQNFKSTLMKVVRIEDTKKNTPVQLVDEAVSLTKSGEFVDGDVVWVVYDRESIVKYSEVLHNKAFQTAQRFGINVAMSNVCFEYWLLLHFVNTTAPYTSCDDLLNKSPFKKLYKTASGKDYIKGDYDIYKIVHKKIADARVRAVALNNAALLTAAAGKTNPFHLNPYCGMPQLLDEIDNF